MNSIQDAEDVTQETFIKAMMSSDDINDLTKTKYWLLSIARRTAIDYLRKKKRRSFFVDLSERLVGDQAENGKTLEEKVLMKEEWKEIQYALTKVKPKYRSLLILRGIKELTIKETAEILQCSELKVRVDYHRAGKLFRKELQKIDEAVTIDGKEQKYFG